MQKIEERKELAGNAVSDIKHKKSLLFTLILVVFVDLLGLSIVLPILGPMLVGKNAILLTSLSNSTRTIILGLLLASYPIMQFFGAPILGALSDRHGRKNILLVTEIGALVGYVIFAIGIMLGNIWIIFASRMLGGFMAGNLAIANSAIADISDKKSRMKNFGLLGMAFGLGFIIGPFLGGNLANPGLVSWFSISTPFWFAAIFSLVNVFLIIGVFKETIKEKIHAEIHPLTGFKNLSKAMKMQNLRTMFIVIFVFMFGFTFYTQFFQVFLIEKFSFNEVMIGNIFAYIGFWVALTQGVLIRPISKKFSPARILTFSLILYPIALLFIMLPNNYWHLLYIIPFMAFFVGLTMPSSTAMVSHLASDDSQGEAMGINQSVQSAAQAIPPILAGIVAAIDFNLPIIVASACFFVAWIIFIAFYRKKKHELFHEV
ncbi:MAG: MFS transporter [Candidatus Pacearchaeota archaeon]|nr:MFS transporter [Candidatus Pacearchaeota archaeon]